MKRLRSTTGGRWWLVWVSGGREWVLGSSKAVNAACLAIFDPSTNSALSRQPESAKKSHMRVYGPLRLMWFTGSARRESVRVRCTREDYSQLQPTAPAVTAPATLLIMLQGKSCGAREAELQGASSVHAGGALAVVQRKLEETAQDDT